MFYLKKSAFPVHTGSAPSLLLHFIISLDQCSQPVKVLILKLLLYTSHHKLFLANAITRYHTGNDGNPVLKNPGIKDFRDPKVFWHNETNQWIMALAVLDRISFYSSPNLKDWTMESEFGKEFGAHGGVWECPDLFPLEYNGETIWVLLVSINPGG
ncbi:MAG: hypothetical protein H0V30_11350, partial [Chitinophagaceae bacterium]|nr:hypothetical protein [Chitinophagaceae bacterium]